MASRLLPALLAQHESEILGQWLDQQRAGGFFAGGTDQESQVSAQSRRFLEELRKGVSTSQFDDINAPIWADARAMLEGLSRDRAQRGYTPSQTATFVFSLKQPVFDLLRRQISNAQELAGEVMVISQLLDRLGLYTTEVFQKSREDIIMRQQEEMLELSTPVVQLWEGVLALPLIGTLDSARTQVVMENLLERIVATGAEIAIVDITGVPTVDTLVAQHLLKTIAAARLMGADCIISGIRPQIAQTIVHLGVELQVTSKANLADAFQIALRRLGKTVVDRSKTARAPTTLTGAAGES